MLSRQTTTLLKLSLQKSSLMYSVFSNISVEKRYCIITYPRDVCTTASLGASLCQVACTLPLRYCGMLGAGPHQVYFKFDQAGRAATASKGRLETAWASSAGWAPRA